jgi:two-component system, chemotaxis family, chemotaxis protein CheY
MQRILVVEDSSLVQSIVKAALRRYGTVQIATVNNGVEALAAIARDGEPDLMLVDINMPRMSGIELLDELRGQGTVPRIPVIIVSTESDDADVQRGLDAGARAYLKKPFRTDDLCKVIDRVMAASTAA